MATTEKLDTHHKALTLNLDAAAFGSFAEIGAGQEVARWFLVVGGASGTVAKTISAYDKEVSDDLYGSGSRYVSKQRLEAMLESEWKQLLTQLNETRGPHTRFFSFVDTISARNFAGTNEPHGWVGLRFQSEPGGPANDILLHINMLDPTNVLEQEAIGILVMGRIEIDYIDVRGPAFETWDRRTLLVYLASAGFAEAVFFPAKGPAVPPTEALYKKAVVLAPGYFGHVDAEHRQVHARLLASGVQQLQNELKETNVTNVVPAGFFCITASSFVSNEPAPEIPDLLRRIDALLASGGDVLLFRQSELYHMTPLVNRYTKAPVRFVSGLSQVIRTFEDLYGHLEGSRLEALGRLFAQNVRAFAYPMTDGDLREWLNSSSTTGWEWNETNGWVSVEQLRRALPLGHLFNYLVASNFLVPMPVPAAETETVDRHM
jgi:hypothetical protein